MNIVINLHTSINILTMQDYWIPSQKNLTRSEDLWNFNKMFQNHPFKTILLNFSGWVFHFLIRYCEILLVFTSYNQSPVIHRQGCNQVVNHIVTIMWQPWQINRCQITKSYQILCWYNYWTRCHKILRSLLLYDWGKY